MTALLPWILWLILDGETQVATPMRYATYDECMKEGWVLAMTVKVDLRITGHDLEPRCTLK